MRPATSFLTAVALDPVPADRGLPPGELLSGRAQRALARAAEDAGADLVTLGDALDTAGLPGVLAARLSALELCAWLAPQTHRVGLVPTVTTTHTEPFLLGAATATLDHASLGRAGVLVTPSLGPGEAANVGRRPDPGPAQAWRETGEVADVLRRLWDSWEDDAEIRDAATGRFVDREKLHYVDFAGTDSAGTPFTVKGPSIVPRPPQGRPPVLVRREPETGLEVLRPAVEQADVVLVPAASAVEDAATLRAWRPGVVVLAAHDPGDVPDPASLTGLVAAGVHGVHVTPGLTGHGDAPARLRAAVAAAGLDGPRGGTLRERLGLPRAVNRYARG
ncbi:LLM class flavin-dependent oxidoreductase [Kocuria sp. M1R5S2]|uniref:LLM class flavin-dependent oxidoreductase n=1 Tax=Kocuria rhizosphaerae TaxID=3376285 RepID=UPI0037B21768